MFPVPEKPTVSDSRVRPLFERYWRYEPLFWPGFRILSIDRSNRSGSRAARARAQPRTHAHARTLRMQRPPRARSFI
jgi:hypothetical protein